MNTLVIIDPQYSFCHPQGELFVPGAVEDTERLSNFIKLNISSINRIVVTKDNHPKVHIGFPSFWVNGSGLHPTVFSNLSLKEDKILDDDGNEFFPTFPELYPISTVKKYLNTVKNHTIWPYHCLQNTVGNTIVDCINDALYEWERFQRKKPLILNKGENPLYEEYSIAQPEDKILDPNWDFLSVINSTNSPNVYWAGEALSHCVKKSVMDSYEILSRIKGVGNWILVKDTSSCVPGYEREANDFVRFCVEKNIGFTTSEVKI